jgi:hypothetical protein
VTDCGAAPTELVDEDTDDVAWQPYDTPSDRVCELCYLKRTCCALAPPAPVRPVAAVTPKNSAWVRRQVGAITHVILLMSIITRLCYQTLALYFLSSVLTLPFLA